MSRRFKRVLKHGDRIDRVQKSSHVRQMQEEQLVILEDFRGSVVPREAAPEAVLAFFSCLPSLPMLSPAQFVADCQVQLKY